MELKPFMNNFRDNSTEAGFNLLSFVMPAMKVTRPSSKRPIPIRKDSSNHKIDL